MCSKTTDVSSDGQFGRAHDYGYTTPIALAASHREAPLIALIRRRLTDVMPPKLGEFRQGDLHHECHPTTGTCFRPELLQPGRPSPYAFHFDLDQDGKPDDLTIEFTFDTEIRDNSRPVG